MPDPAWAFGGDIGRPLTSITVNTGTDYIGDYDEITFDYTAGVSVAGAALQDVSRQAGQFVSLGQKRITEVVDNGTLEATIAFAGGETSRTVQGYSPTALFITAVKGALGQPSYDPAIQLFSVDGSPDADGCAIVDINPS